MKKIYVIVCGISLGYLIGLSESAIISSVISAMLSVVVSLLIGLSGLAGADNSKLNVKVDVRPIALFILFLAIGSSVGVYVRTHNYLGVAYDGKGEFNPAQYKSSQGKLYNTTQTLKLQLEMDKYDPTKLRDHLKLVDSKSIQFFLEQNPSDSVVLDFATILLCE